MYYKSVEWGKPSTVISCYINVIYTEQGSLSVMNQEIAVHATQYISSYRRFADPALRQNICLAVQPWLTGEVSVDDRVDVQHRDYRIEAYSPRKTISCTVAVEVGSRKYKAWLTEMTGGQVFVTFKGDTTGDADQYRKQEIRRHLILEFKRKFLGIDDGDSTAGRQENQAPAQPVGKKEPTVSFHDEEKERGICLADVCYADGRELRNLQVLYLGENSIAVYQISETDERRTPVSSEVHSCVHTAFQKQMVPGEFSKYRSSVQGVEKTRFGRVKNALSDNVITFRRNQVLREEHILNGEFKRVMPMNRLQQISAFETDVLTWINELRYTTSDMLTDLVEAGIIFSGTLNFQKNKLPKQMGELNQYGLVDISRFATLDDTGRLIEDSKMRSIAYIYTLGYYGDRVLKQLGREHQYNAFERFQDGNIVKAILAVNQWLVYWLAAYPQEFIGNYQSSRVVYIRDAQINGARLHASVVRGDCIVIGEPVRRSDQKDKEQQIRDKFQRFMDIFSADASSLYCSYNVVDFPAQKILCYICEDEAHIEEVHEMLLPCLQNYPGQEIWFTTDLKMHNYNEEGKRFITFGSQSQPEYVNMEQRLSLGKERAWLEEETE